MILLALLVLFTAGDYLTSHASLRQALFPLLLVGAFALFYVMAEKAGSGRQFFVAGSIDGDTSHPFSPQEWRSNTFFLSLCVFLISYVAATAE